MHGILASSTFPFLARVSIGLSVRIRVGYIGQRGILPLHRVSVMNKQCWELGPVELTFDVVLHICRFRLIVMDHLNNQQ